LPLPGSLPELPFHLDHVIAQQHGAPSVLENLAPACCYCINRADAVAVIRLLIQEGVFQADPVAN
jgi:hypothetical protein